MYKCIVMLLHNNYWISQILVLNLNSSRSRSYFEIVCTSFPVERESAKHICSSIFIKFLITFKGIRKKERFPLIDLVISNQKLKDLKWPILSRICSTKRRDSFPAIFSLQFSNFPWMLSVLILHSIVFQRVS